MTVQPAGALTPEERDLIWFHLAFALAAALGLLAPLGLPAGPRLLGLVVLYNIALPLFARWRGRADWIRLWQFLVPLSALQVIPDWFLAQELGVLVFPDTGSPRLGPVPLFMAGMWTIPLFAALMLGQRVEARRGWRAGLAAAGLAALVVLAGSEATLWAVPVWQAQNVRQVAHVALYVLAPEAVLGLATYVAYRWTAGRGRALQLAAACVLSQLYLGSLGFFYLLLEGLAR